MVVVSRKASSDQLSFERYSLLYGQKLVILSKSSLTLFVHHQYELNHRRKILIRDDCFAKVLALLQNEY